MSRHLMGPQQDKAKIDSRRAQLRAEIDAIHHANRLYWQQEDAARTTEEIAEYHRRLERLDEIRKELSDLEA